MRLLKLVPDDTSIDFIGLRRVAFTITILMLLVAIGALMVRGLNLGIDFRGGILIDATYKQAVDVAGLRGSLGGLGLGEISLQTFGDDHTILIRVQRQEGGDAENAKAIEKIRTALGDGWTYNRSEAVGPTVGAELMKKGIWATIAAMMMVGVYVGLRYEWQFGVAALVATFHDVFVSLGLVALLGWEFNLTTVAALLTLAGYSINDTVIVFDRVREMLRRYKRRPMTDIINLSTNSTLSRTLLTSVTVLLAVLPMMFLGGETLAVFTGVIAFGVLVGTFSSIYVASALLLYMPPLRMSDPSGSEKAQPAA